MRLHGRAVDPEFGEESNRIVIGGAITAEVFQVRNRLGCTAKYPNQPLIEHNA
jgi:hypothetical protein